MTLPDATRGAPRRVLMVAFHFPPMHGSSGIQRTLRFVQHLPTLGWQPFVLTAHPRAYERTSTDLDAEVPPSVTVRRAFALDTARHLAFRGRYPTGLARPDRWSSWRHDAVRQGMRLIREHKVDALWSTYPIATAHVIGAELQRRTGLPWIADFRDPMAQDGYPEDPKTWSCFAAIEKLAADRASQLCFTTPSAAATYRTRFPQAAHRMAVLENGFDEDSFVTAEAKLNERQPLNPGFTTLLHSGTVYPSERDPTQLIAALALMKAESPAAAQRLRVRFRAAGHEDLLSKLAQQRGVSDMIELLPPVGYGPALAEMLVADGLLVLQASNCNQQVPAKIYEYLRARRPIVCLSDSEGDTCRVLQRAGVSRIAPLDNAPAIAGLLQAFADGDRSGFLAPPEAVAAASRRSRAAELAGLLANSLGAARAPGAGLQTAAGATP